MRTGTPNKFTQPGLLGRLIEDLSLLFSLIKDCWKGTYREISIWSVLVFLLAIAYIFFPMDLLPDYMPGIGQIDDTVIILLCLYFLEKDLYKYKEWKNRNT